MTLGAKRRQFTHMLALLILHAEQLGYGVAADYLKRCVDCPIGLKNSVHMVGLGIDLNLYNKQNQYLTSGVHHEKLHDYWDSIGGAPRIDNNLNHSSLSHQGVR